MFIIPTYAQTSSVTINTKITPTWFSVNMPSSGSLHVVLAILIIKIIKYNTVVCRFDKILVNVVIYVIPG